VIELTTGLPGSGKTLYTICRIKQKAEAENRPVYYSGIPDLKLPWIQLDDPTQWHTLPANSICVIDEAQRVFRPRGNGSQVPEHVEKLETHRHQGIDLIIITQHPMLIDSNVRRLVGQHYHVSRPFGWKKAKIFRFESARENPLSKQNEGSRIDFVYPKQAFEWYKSAEVHTVKARLPWQVVAMFVLPLLAIGLIWWFYQSKTAPEPKPGADGITEASGATSGTGAISAPPRQRDPRKTTAEYVREQQPRVAGLAYSAPIYDEVTKPVHAPYPAACVTLRGECRCYSQQGTRLSMDRSLCENIVKEGFFIAWDTRGPEQRETRNPQRQAHAPLVASADNAMVSSIAIPAPPPPAPLSETSKTAQIEQQPYQPRVPASSPRSMPQ
jgi:zona occludens toxin